MVAPRRSLVARPDAVLPVVSGGEVAPWPAQERDAEAARGVHDVLAEAVGVGERALLLEHPAVHAPSELLDEVAEHVRVHLADHALGIEFDARLGRLGGKGPRAERGHGGRGQAE